MIPPSDPQHRAQYTDDGQIVIPAAVVPHEREDARMEEIPMEQDDLSMEAIFAAIDGAPSVKQTFPDECDTPGDRKEEEQETAVPVRFAMRTIAQAVSEQGTQALRQSAKALSGIGTSVQTLGVSVLEEGSRQYRASATETADIGTELYEGTRSLGRTLLEFLAQPVWVPGKRSVPKQRSRGALFTLDVVRFGGTFAGIFLALFLALNYQSFWEIARARMEPLSQADLGEGPLGAELRNVLTDQAGGAVPIAADAGNLFSYVPPVGPPQPQLIIPKLGLNVPIVIPSNDALVRQDWKALEETIQHSLQNGVVHYPGTADPGQGGNFFLTGHSSYYPWDPGKYKSVFARLGDLNVGDEYWVYFKGDKHRYIIRQKKEVYPSEVSVLEQPGDQRISTLMTCTPVGTTLRRLIIEAQEVDPVSGEALGVGQHGSQDVLPKVQVEALPV